AVTMFRDRREPEEVATLVSQLFLGIRLECARCHHHPFEKWSQDDFFSFAAHFQRLGFKGVGVSPPISGGEEMILTGPARPVRHPVTQRELSPRPLFPVSIAADSSSPDADPRDLLADWVTST